MNWINIVGSDIPEGEPLLFQEKLNNNFHVGYWSEEENCMVENPYGGDGCKWSVGLWSYIDRPKAGNK